MIIKSFGVPYPTLSRDIVYYDLAIYITFSLSLFGYYNQYNQYY